MREIRTSGLTRGRGASPSLLYWPIGLWNILFQFIILGILAFFFGGGLDVLGKDNGGSAHEIAIGAPRFPVGEGRPFIRHHPLEFSGQQTDVHHGIGAGAAGKSSQVRQHQGFGLPGLILETAGLEDGNRAVRVCDFPDKEFNFGVAPFRGIGFPCQFFDGRGVAPAKKQGEKKGHQKPEKISLVHNSPYWVIFWNREGGLVNTNFPAFWEYEISCSSCDPVKKNLFKTGLQDQQDINETCHIRIDGSRAVISV